VTDRQTHQRCKHPTLGEGVAIYDNGPARFVADSGETVAYSEIGWGGYSAHGPMKSWLIAVDVNGRTNLDTSDQKRGERHRRIATMEGRRGWLVELQVTRGWLSRFEPDDGAEPETFAYTVWSRGTPKQQKAPPTAKWCDWMANPWHLLGTSFCYCREEDYPGPEAALVAKLGPKAAKAKAKPEPSLFPNEGG
jgi:hypothetical protein